MFTGIITHIGKLQIRKDSLYTFEVVSSFVKKLELGTSVSINGACMTVTDLSDEQSFSVEIMPESQKKTMLVNLIIDDLVNLELPATPDTFLSGHIVQGHVDGTGEIVSIKEEGISKIVAVSVSKNLQKYIVEKGSIAVNGISLTIIDVNNETFRVGIIPHTWKNTMLQNSKLGDTVNIETDIIAKYAEKLLGKEV